MVSDLSQPTLLRPAANVFATRAERFATLSTGHSLEPWLAWLSRFCTLQQKLADTLAPARVTQSDQLPYIGHSHPELLETAIRAHRQLRAGVLELPSTPESRTLLLQPLSDAEITNTILAVLAHAAELAPIEGWNVNHLVSAAAVQVVWHHAVCHLGLPAESSPAVTPDICPCCGSLATGSIIMTGGNKEGVRYLECSLCSSRWHAVRARCTLCDSVRPVSYLSIEGNRTVLAETCDQCHGYLKLYQQTGDIHVDPIADDLATLALDVLVGEQGFYRAGPNLLMHESTADA